MFTIRKGSDRGQTNIGWLKSWHSFSFGDYYDPANHHYRSLRVINDDIVAGGGGFPTHPHRDMEILTWVLSGELEHKDSMGNGSVIRPGEWQYMSAGTGVAHSEFNRSASVPVHLLQIWIVPDKKGHTPRYGQKSFADAPVGAWTLTVSPDGADGSLAVRQDVRLNTAKVEAGTKLAYDVKPGRGVWLHVATGAADVNGQRLAGGDAVAVEGEAIEVVGVEKGEVLLFDLG
jgi:redox-sensitive bicupin YhaK (pirin superfamily)